MNRFNPLYVGILLLLLLAFFVMQLAEAKKELHEEKKLYEKSLQLALETSALKKAFADKTKEKREILRILTSSVLKNADVKKKLTNSGIYISAKNMDRNALNYFMGKILNATFVITKLQIKKTSENKATLEVKIKW